MASMNTKITLNLGRRSHGAESVSVGGIRSFPRRGIRSYGRLSRECMASRMNTADTGAVADLEDVFELVVKVIIDMHTKSEEIDRVY